MAVISNVPSVIQTLKNPGKKAISLKYINGIFIVK